MNFQKVIDKAKQRKAAHDHYMECLEYAKKNADKAMTEIKKEA